MKFKSPIISQASGSIAGTTYAHNAGGLYMRARSIPTNPNTLNQQRVRSVLGAMANRWHSVLTAVQRAAWAAYAAAVPLTDPLGSSINVSGQNMYIRFNVPNVSMGNSGLTVAHPIGTPVDDAPTTPDTGVGVATITSFEKEAAGTVTIKGTYSAPQPYTGSLLLQVGNPISLGRSYYKGPYRLAGRLTAVISDATFTMGPLDLTDTAEWIGGYSPAVGDRVPIRMSVITLDGRLSQAYKSIETITGTA